MGDIVEFPGFDERAWRAMDDAFRGGLKQCGASDEGTEWILSEWKRRMRLALPSLQFSLDVVCPANATQGERKLAETVGNAVMDRWRDLLQNVAGQLMLAIVDLYHAQPGNPPAASKQTIADILKFIPVGKDADGNASGNDGSKGC
jgi:hypothetical protein